MYDIAGGAQAVFSGIPPGSVSPQPQDSSASLDRSAQQIHNDIERAQREITEIADQLGIAELNQPAPQVDVADLAAGVFNQSPAPSEFVGDRSAQQLKSDIERLQRENAE